MRRYAWSLFRGRAEDGMQAVVGKFGALLAFFGIPNIFSVPKEFVFSEHELT